MTTSSRRRMIFSSCSSIFQVCSSESAQERIRGRASSVGPAPPLDVAVDAWRSSFIRLCPVCMIEPSGVVHDGVDSLSRECAGIPSNRVAGKCSTPTGRPRSPHQNRERSRTSPTNPCGDSKADTCRVPDKYIGAAVRRGSLKHRISSAAIQNPISPGKKQQRYHDQPHTDAFEMAQDRIRTHPCTRWPMSFGVSIRRPGGHREPPPRRPERSGGRYGQGPAYG